MSDCWHTQADNMIKAYEKQSPLSENKAGKALLSLIKEVPFKSRVVELGCGTGFLGELFPDYLGVDFPYIIDNVARVLNPLNAYLRKDATAVDVGDFDLVLMSAFIDVQEEPLKVLEGVLSYATKYVILHRQEVTKSETKVEKKGSYGGWTWHSKISRAELEYLFRYSHFEILQEENCGYDNWEDGGSSFLLKKQKTKQ